nr:60S ribosomal protein L13 [Cryptomonas sp.]
MVKHNNKITNTHFRKHWQSFVKTWFNQPAQKKRRRQKRFNNKKNYLFSNAQKILIRPLIHCPSHMYNMKVRFGKGFSLSEIKKASIPLKHSNSLGISVDKRKKNKTVMEIYNVARLNNYISKIVYLKKTKQKFNSQNIQVSPIQRNTNYLKKPFRSF